MYPNLTEIKKWITDARKSNAAHAHKALEQMRARRQAPAAVSSPHTATQPFSGGIVRNPINPSIITPARRAAMVSAVNPFKCPGGADEPGDSAYPYATSKRLGIVASMVESTLLHSTGGLDKAMLECYQMVASYYTSAHLGYHSGYPREVLSSAFSSIFTKYAAACVLGKDTTADTEQLRACVHAFVSMWQGNEDEKERLAGTHHFDVKFDFLPVAITLPSEVFFAAMIDCQKA